MKKLILALGMTIGLSAPAAALEFACSVRSTGDGFISSAIAVQFEPGQSTAMVYDRYIHAVHGQPIQATVRQRSLNPDEYRISWTVNNVPARPSPIRIGYQAVINIKTNRIIVRGSIRGVTNSLNGNGTCRQGTLKLNG
ncbi:hypothetical protein KUV51_13400 [Tateyamaria omphalii]|uniref:hypothetical protein n=1 Tax=Tateyamaria omphalii TaxID=299262 RepID=UPI001C9A0EC6|nr:hypothetical protein [Tateyamaria omphalii]MBY5934001.1 hypothetical protein [Tateyamaria omphalii]